MSASERHSLTPTTRRDGSPTVPRRGYSWPPFAAGNLAHVTHGTRSQRLVSERAEAIHAALIEVAPWVTDLDVEAVDRYCRAEGRARMLHEYAVATAAERGVEAVSSFVWTEATRAEANAAKFAADLGLDPAGRAKLAKDLGVAVHFGGDQLADLADQGRAIRERRQAELDANEGGQP
jgi:hypothetical protein